MAIAAMPSRRPVKPRPSVVVALTPTRATLDAQDLADTRPHGLAMRCNLRGLAQQRHVDVGDGAAQRGDAPCSIGQEQMRRRTLPSGIARREVLADIAVTDGAEQGVGQCMQAHIGIRVSQQAMRVADA